MRIPDWVPETPRPSSLIGDGAWKTMTREERQKSFLVTDLPVIAVGGSLMIYGMGLLGLVLTALILKVVFGRK